MLRDQQGIAAQAREQLKSRRAVMLNEAEGYADACRQYDECDTQRIEAELADILLKAGVKVREADFQQVLTTRAAARDRAPDTPDKTH